MQEETIQKVQKYLQQFKENPSLSTIPTGYAVWDALTGGLVQGGLTVIAGRPAMGRSTLALNVVNRLSKNISGTVLVLSTNAFGEETARRILEIGTGLCSGEMLDGSVPTEEAIARYTTFVRERKCKIRTGISCSLEDIYEDCYGISDLRLVVVLAPEGICKPIELATCEKDLMDRESMDKIVRTLRALAQELDVAVLCTAYLPQSLERRKNKRPKLTDLKKVNLPADVADQIVLLYRDNYYNRESDSTAELEIAGTYFGDTGKVYLQWDGKTGRFSEGNG